MATNTQQEVSDAVDGAAGAGYVKTLANGKKVWVGPVTGDSVRGAAGGEYAGMTIAEALAKAGITPDPRGAAVGPMGFYGRGVEVPFDGRLFGDDGSRAPTPASPNYTPPYPGIDYPGGGTQFPGQGNVTVPPSGNAAGGGAPPGTSGPPVTAGPPAGNPAGVPSNPSPGGSPGQGPAAGSAGGSINPGQNTNNPAPQPGGANNTPGMTQAQVLARLQQLMAGANNAPKGNQAPAPTRGSTEYTPYGQPLRSFDPSYLIQSMREKFGSKGGAGQTYTPPQQPQGYSSPTNQVMQTLYQMFEGR